MSHVRESSEMFAMWISHVAPREVKTPAFAERDVLDTC